MLWGDLEGWDGVGVLIYCGVQDRAVRDICLLGEVLDSQLLLQPERGPPTLKACRVTSCRGLVDASLPQFPPRLKPFQRWDDGPKSGWRRATCTSTELGRDQADS